MKPHDKNAGAAKPSGEAGSAAATKKPVLSIPEKPAPSSVQCSSSLFLPPRSFGSLGVSLMVPHESVLSIDGYPGRPGCSEIRFLHSDT